MAKQEQHEVIKDFQDGKDGRHLYRKGDLYPREDGKTTKKRIEQLQKHEKGPFLSGEPVKDEDGEKKTEE